MLKLYPRKIVKYFCYPGFHLWGQDIVECDPENPTWPKNGTFVNCLVDSALNKIAFASSSGLKALIPLNNAKYSKHKGNFLKVDIATFSFYGHIFVCLFCILVCL